MAQAIVDLAGPTRQDLVVEIGPGRGALTALLAERAGRLLAIEVDQALASRLSREFSGLSHVEILHADARRVDYADLATRRPDPAGRVVVVGNLPYSVSKPILARLLDAGPTLSRMVLTLQREVAERVVAEPGPKRYGALSVLTRLYWDARLAFTIPPEAFAPSPQVESAVVQLVPLPGPRVRLEDERFFCHLVKAAFAQRRKTLANGLAGGLRMPPADVRRGLALAGIDPTRRAETLSLPEFARAASALGIASRREGGVIR